jgi:hypothetical protein
LVIAFLNDDDGAVTVDWTVLTGALVGLGLATMAVVSGGTEDLSRDISEMLQGIIDDAAANILYFGGFDDGFEGWSNGVVTNGSDFGPILGPFGGSNGAVATEQTFNIPAGTEVASFTFDMIAIDSWDDEEFIVFVDGAPAASLQFRYGTDGVTGQWVSDNPDYSFEVLNVTPRGNAGYNPGWPDQSATVQLNVSNPGDTVTLGFGSTLNQERSDESFAIDNVTLRAE